MKEPETFAPWLTKVLKPPGNTSPCGTPPSEMDVDILIRALAGANQSHLKASFSTDAIGVRSAIVRVRDAVRQGEIPEKLKSECPWFSRRFSAHQISQTANQTECQVTLQAIEPLRTDQVQAIAGITDHPYPALDLDDPDAVTNFLAEAKARFAVATGPLALRRLAEQVAVGHPRSVTEARDFLYGSSRGPTFAFQQNFVGPGGTGSAPGRARSGDSYADIILEYEKCHPEEAGEVTQFEEDVLKDSNEGSE